MISMLNKKAFFSEPGATAILQGRTSVTKKGSLIYIIEELKPNESYIIDSNIIPEISREGIPYVSRDSKEELPQRFLKRGPLVELNNNDLTLGEAIKSKKRILDLRRERFGKIRIDEFELAGYGFWGIRNRSKYHRFNLVSCIKGARLYAYSQLAKEESELIKILEYDLHDKDRYYGADVIMEVPSERITQPKYDITLRSVPVSNVLDKYAIAYDFDADHVCKFKSTMVSKRFAARESFQDFHICAAYLAFIDHEIKTRKNKVPLEMCPFAIPTQKFVDFYSKLVNNVVVRYKEGDNVVKRATNQAEREILLWRFVAKHGHDETVYATKKLREYKW